MTFVSYAQNYEDVVLWRALRDVEGGFYVDVGAADPTETRSLRHFTSAAGQASTLSRPNPTSSALQSERRATSTCACSPALGQEFVPSMSWKAPAFRR